MVFVCSTTKVLIVVSVIYCTWWIVFIDKYFIKVSTTSSKKVSFRQSQAHSTTNSRIGPVVTEISTPAIPPKRVLFLFGDEEGNGRQKYAKITAVPVATAASSSHTGGDTKSSTTGTVTLPYETPIASWNREMSQILEREKLSEEQDYECVPMYDWQQYSFPSCNSLHELPISQPETSSLHFINCGMSRCAFHFKDDSDHTVVVKLIRHDKDKKGDITPTRLEQSRTDSLIMERLTSSQYIQTIYGYCGVSQILEYSQEGNIHDRIKQARQLSDEVDEQSSAGSTTSQAALANRERLTKKRQERQQQQQAAAALSGRRTAGYGTRTSVARPTTARRVYSSVAADRVFGSSRNKVVMMLQVLNAVADLHGYGGIAHKDICCHQIVNFGGVYKLGDFHGASLMERNTTYESTSTTRACGEEPNGFEKVRSPEEYRGLITNKQLSHSSDEVVVDGHKMDVYMTGNVIYYILSHQWLFEHASSIMTHKVMSQGKRSNIPTELQESEDPYVILMLNVLDKCWTDDPMERPTARSILNFAQEHFHKIQNTTTEKVSGTTIKLHLPPLPKDHRFTDSDFMSNLEI